MAAKKKLILFLGQADSKVVSGVQGSLGEALASHEVIPQIVWARDGADAALKIENQKFDAVVIDTQASRLKEAHFLMSLHTHRSTDHADLIAILPSATDPLPVEFEKANQVLCKPYDVESLVRALCKALASDHKVATAKQDCSFSVDVRVLNGILKSTLFICQQFGLQQIQMQKPQMKQTGQLWKGDIGAMIAIQSRIFQGAMILSFDQKPYLKMYETMLGEAQSELNDENSEAIGEISNMILGNAKSDFTNYDVEMTLPKALKSGQAFSYPSGSASILIPGQCDSGNLYLEVVAYSLRK